MRFYPEREFHWERCTSCGTCARICPTGAVRIEEKRLEFVSGSCIGCGHCGIYCPVDAFCLGSAGSTPVVPPEDYRDMLRFRRSVRSFNQELPSEEDIEDLVSVVGFSPTGRNAQGLLVRSFRGPDAVAGLLGPVRRLAVSISRTGLPGILGRFAGAGDYIERLAAGEDLVFRNAPVVLFFFAPRRNVTARSDGIIAATTVMHHGISMGMGTLWNGVAEKLYPLMFSWHVRETRGMLLTAVLCIGYTDLSPMNEAPERNFTHLRG